MHDCTLRRKEMKEYKCLITRYARKLAGNRSERRMNSEKEKEKEKEKEEKSRASTRRKESTQCEKEWWQATNENECCAQRTVSLSGGKKAGQSALPSDCNFAELY